MADEVPLSRKEVQKLIATLREHKSEFNVQTATALDSLWRRAQRAELLLEVSKKALATQRRTIFAELAEVFTDYAAGLEDKANKASTPAAAKHLLVALASVKGLSEIIKSMEDKRRENQK